MPEQQLATVDEIEEEEYRAFVAELEERVPAIVPEKLDFARILGDNSRKSGKAIVLHLACNCGWSIREIAEKLGLSATMTRKYLCEAIYEATPLENVEIVRKFELMKLDALERICQVGIERSFEDAESTHETLSKDGDVVELKSRTRQSGSPGWAKVKTEIAKLRASLLGLAKPTEVRVDKTERKLVIKQIIVQDAGDVVQVEGRPQ